MCKLKLGPEIDSLFGQILVEKLLDLNDRICGRRRIESDSVGLSDSHDLDVRPLRVESMM